MTAPPAALAAVLELARPAALALSVLLLGADAALAWTGPWRTPGAARRDAGAALACAGWVLLCGVCLLLAPHLPPLPGL